MLLSGVLFILFLAGCWLYCLTDAALTPAAAFRGLPKAAWIGIIAATFIVGAVAWLVTRRSRRTRSWASPRKAGKRRGTPAYRDPRWHLYWTAADEAVARHPAGRSRTSASRGWTPPKGPDDDPEFLLELDRLIRGTWADPGE